MFFVNVSFAMCKSSDSSRQASGKAVPFKLDKMSPEEGQELEGLKGVQMYLHIDISNSLMIDDRKPPTSIISKCIYRQSGSKDKWMRWDSIKVLALHFIGAMVGIDDDGKVPVYLFSDQVDSFTVRNGDELIKRLSKKCPKGGTEMEMSLGYGFDDQEEPTARNKALHVVLTDGAPTNASTRTGNSDIDLKKAQEGVKNLIQKRIVDKGYLTDDKASVLFVQVGDDSKANKFLNYLDDCEDIGGCVDTKHADIVYKSIESVGDVSHILLNGIYENMANLEYEGK